MKTQRKYAWPVFLFFFFVAAWTVIGQLSFYSQPTDDEAGMVDVYNVYYVLEIQKFLGIGNHDLNSRVQENLEEKGMTDLEEIMLSPLPAIWFLTRVLQEKPSDIQAKEFTSFVLSLQQDNGMFVNENGEELQEGENITPYLFSTKLAIEILNRYEEPIPKQKELIQAITDRLDNRLDYGKDMILDGNNLLILEILVHLDPEAKILQRARETISMDMIQVSFLKENFSLGEWTTLKGIADILHPGKPFNKVIQSHVETQLKDLQLKNGAFRFPESQEPAILSTYLAILLMKEWEIDIPKKENILEYTDEIAEASF
ncbi:hypothetical protein [Mesobacillus foraminis]|uniref:Prenyltransferase/squalene oxidase-like repeat protein n=1 Tax=Mesobacillus foraminis TaxID=279826 RepID=A0A4R2B2P0_9BACI|nr:hypothetical protein [Mesobacillus foraminis]TCN19764.1 hypothetical protein EV146_11669 [Mesobacillus foraminis]